MKLAAKQADLASCKYVSEDAKAKLSAAAAPPIRLITLAADGREVEAGNETVLFRHEKTFYNPTGLFVRVQDTMSAAEITALAKAVADYKVDYVGMALRLDGLAVECASGDPATFGLAVATVSAAVTVPVILVSEDPKVLEAGVAKMAPPAAVRSRCSAPRPPRTGKRWRTWRRQRRPRWSFAPRPSPGWPS